MKNHWTYVKGKWQASYLEYMAARNVCCPGCRGDFLQLELVFKQKWNKTTNAKDWDCICECGAEMVLIA
jgi:hypothetical protein